MADLIHLDDWRWHLRQTELAAAPPRDEDADVDEEADEDEDDDDLEDDGDEDEDQDDEAADAGHCLQAAIAFRSAMKRRIALCRASASGARRIEEGCTVTPTIAG